MIAKHSMIYRGILYRKGQWVPMDEPMDEPQPEPQPTPDPEPEPEPEPEIEPAELPKLK